MTHVQGRLVVNADVEWPRYDVCTNDGPSLHPGGREGLAIQLAPEAEAVGSLFSPGGAVQEARLLLANLLNNLLNED
ncbi:MAG: hypothetical protein ACKPKO_37565, partial [Candidatus Fonsibacter sp.]